ncbi:hypothetical protein THASP1DRAFT_29386 [Thamnocephalis sphaerospora]|uniref:Fe2OG dioxygenase domain-containing protein n=1 Tax=Thamnocephalis sphaerospora TaxID=78915 RepID=A0A4P9XTP7_9FUNG|nr:hypothetical protein THASP1DRAFT_29386 [Thamnocephalis sphaerospora]|eukprot:RKP08810.1 hypothetical protein THASP1DRAFT_29386 [Thamnocephalis sphaerospora]
MTVLNLPVVDFGPYLDPNSTAEQRQAVDQAIDKACRHLGVFILKNHGVPDELCNRMLDCIRRFIQLPDEEKRKCSVASKERGYVQSDLALVKGLRPPHENIAFYPPVNGFSNGLSPTVDPNSPDARLPTSPDALGMPDAWPSDEFRAQTEEYLEHMLQLKNRVHASIATSLGLGALSQKRFDDTIFASAFNGYRELTEAEVIDGGTNLPEHTDLGLLTFLSQDSDSTSLQVQDRDGKWYDVQPIPGAFVVNVGVMLNRWTAGQYHATVHRVIHRSKKPRISAAVFVDPFFDASIAPLSELTPAGKSCADQKAETFGKFSMDWYNSSEWPEY